MHAMIGLGRSGGKIYLHARLLCTHQGCLCLVLDPLCSFQCSFLLSVLLALSSFCCTPATALGHLHTAVHALAQVKVHLTNI